MTEIIRIPLSQGGVVILSPAGAEELFEKLRVKLGKTCACGGRGKRCVI